VVVSLIGSSVAIKLKSCQITGFVIRFSGMDDLKGVGPGAEQAPGPAAGFFERYFEALDGPEPLSALELVSPDLQFAILFSTKLDERSRQFLGGPDELRAFTEAGDMEGWAHHILARTVVDDVQIVLGETRRDDGTHLGTFVNAARIGADGRMTHYVTARTPGLRFGAAESPAP
jgi:hypothetical protein